MTHSIRRTVLLVLAALPLLCSASDRVAEALAASLERELARHELAGAVWATTRPPRAPGSG